MSFYILAASLVSLNKAPVLSLSTVGSQCFDLNPIQSFLLLQLVSFPIIWGICQRLLHCRFVSLVLLCQKLPKSLLCRAHCSRIKTFVVHFAVALTFCVGHSLVSIHYIMSSAFLVVKFSTNFRSNQSLTYLVLDDEGCLNAFLPTDLFLSTATHLALGMRFIFL